MRDLIIRKLATSLERLIQTDFIHRLLEEIEFLEDRIPQIIRLYLAIRPVRSVVHKKIE